MQPGSKTPTLSNAFSVQIGDRKYIESQVASSVMSGMFVILFIYSFQECRECLSVNVCVMV